MLMHYRLFIGGIPRHINQTEVEEEVKRYCKGVREVILYRSIYNDSKNRGYAFVEFESHQAASEARRNLVPPEIRLWNGSQIRVDWATPQDKHVDEDTMLKVKNVAYF